MEASGSSNTVALPAGTTVGAGRQTTELNSAGQVISVMAYTVTTPKGSVITVSVPLSEIGNTAKVKSDIATRVNHVDAIST